jgi:hypothetical protein
MEVLTTSDAYYNWNIVECGIKHHNPYPSFFVDNLYFYFIIIFLDQHAELDFYSARSLKQQSMGRHVAPLGHIILIPSQPVFALSI